MSDSAVNVELRLRFADRGAAAGVDRLGQHIRRAATEAETAVNQGNNRQRQSYERLSHARETLGVRSESQIQREIQRTQAAYRRLENSGTMSQSALSRAAQITTQRITRLTNEMGRLTEAQIRANRAAADYERMQSRIRLGMAGVIGLGAAAYTLKAPVMKAMSFDERLASMANTAYAERDVKGRLLGAKQLENTINQSVDLKRGGGGTREQAAEALDAMMAKGNMGFQKSLDFLPTVMRTAYGAQAEPLDIANLSSALYGQGVVKDDKGLKTALNMITAAGQAGGFEIKDMAKYLPGQLAVGVKNGGLVGLPGLQKILTMNEAAVLTAQDTSSAANNVLNLLTKIASPDTAKDFKRAGRGDLAAFLVSQRINGVDSVDAWMNLIDKESEKNPVMEKALAKLKTSTTKADQKEAIEAIAQMSEGTIISKYFQDMQARGALFGLRNTNLTSRVNADISKNRTEYGANDLNYETMKGTGAAELRNAEQELAIRQKEAMEKLIPTITKAANMFVDLSQKYPDLSAAVVGATPPVIALGAASSLAAVSMGGLSGSMGMLAGGIGNVLKVTAAFGAGYVFGDKVVKPVIDKITQIVTNNEQATLGSAVYDLFNAPPPSMRLPGQPSHTHPQAHIVVDVAHGMEVKRKETKSVTVTANTGNIVHGAP
jgi:hypothetical protein